MPQWGPNENTNPRKLTNIGKNLAERFSGSAAFGVESFERGVVIILTSGARYKQGSSGANLHDG